MSADQYPCKEQRAQSPSISRDSIKKDKPNKFYVLLKREKSMKST